MSDEPLTNALIERLRDSNDGVNELSQPPSIALADDFVISDRRTGVNFGEGDASHFVRMFEGF